MSGGHWTEDAERVYEGDYLGECDMGCWWVRAHDEATGVEGWVHFSRRNLRHWLVYWRSRRANRLVWLERSR